MADLNSKLASGVDSAKNKAIQQAQSASQKLQSKLDSKLGGKDRLGKALTKAIGLKRGGIEGATKDQVGKLLDSKLAKTLFKAGPKDELLTVDPLGISDSSILSSLSGKLSGFDSSLLDGLRQGSGIISDLGGLIKRDGMNFSFDSAQLKDRVMSALGGKQNLLRNLGDDVSKLLVQGAGITDPSIYAKVDAVVDGVVTQINAGGFKDARGMLDLVNHMTGKSDLAQFFDTGAEANLLSGLCQQAIVAGVPKVVEQLVEKSRSSDAADAALSANVVTAVRNGDHATTNLIIQKLGVSRVLGQSPNAVEELLRAYKLPDGTAVEDYPARYAEFKAVLDQLNPNWGRVYRNGSPIFDLAVFNLASADAKKLLQTDPQWALVLRIASSYTAKPLAATAKSQYPLAAL